MWSTSPRRSRLPVALVLLVTAVGAGPTVRAAAEPSEDPTPLTVVSAAYQDFTGGGIAPLADGGAVLAGHRIGGSLRAVTVERIDAAGSSVWRQDFTDLAGDSQHPVSVVADATRIVVAGAVSRSRDDGFVRILDHDGTVLSTTSFASSDNGREVITGIALAGDGSILVVGRTGGELVVPRIAPTGTDGFVALVEPDGTVAWTRQIARRWGETGPVPTIMSHALVAPDGRLIAVSRVFCNQEAWCAGQEPELAFLVHDRDGTLADVVRVPYADIFTGASLTRLYVGAILPGPEGLVVTAYESGGSDALWTGGLDWDLSPSWAGPSVLGTDGGLFSHRSAAAVAADGRIVLGAATYYGAEIGGPNQGGPDGLIAVLSARGELLHVVQHGGPAPDDVTGVAVLDDGRALVAGYAGEGLVTDGLAGTGAFTGTRFLVSLDPGATRYAHDPGVPGIANTVSTDDEWGDPTSSESSEGEEASPPAPVVGANGLLALVSSTRVAARGGEVSMRPGSTGTVTAGWATEAPFPLGVTLSGDDGTVLWGRTFDDVTVSSNGAIPRVDAADVVDAGARIVVATSASASSGGNDGHVLMFDAEGELLWSAELNAPAGKSILVTDVHLAPDGSVITVGGSSALGDGYRPIIARHGADGGLLWMQQLERSVRSTLGSVHVAPDGTIVALESEGRFCSVAEPCSPRADVHLLRVAPEDGSVMERVTHDLGDVLGMTIRFRVDGSPYASLLGMRSGPVGPVAAGLVLNDVDAYCLVVAGFGWDLGRRFAGPPTHCEGEGLEGWGDLTVLGDGRVVTGASSYYDVAVAGPSLGHVDVVVGVHDEAGVLLDAVQYGGTFQDIATGLVATPDGDVLVATSAGAGVTSLGAAPSVTAVGERTRLTLVDGVGTWRDVTPLRSGVDPDPDATDTSAASSPSVDGGAAIGATAAGTSRAPDGTVVPLLVTAPGPGRLRYSAAGIAVTLTGGPGTSPTSGLTVDSAGTVECEICTALATGGTAEVWLNSEPRLLARWTVEDLPCQRVTLSVADPLDGGGPPPAGTHTLRLVLPGPAGTTTVDIGVTVDGREVPTGIPAGEGARSPVRVRWEPGALAVMLVALVRRRRQILT